MQVTPAVEIWLLLAIAAMRYRIPCFKLSVISGLVLPLPI